MRVREWMSRNPVTVAPDTPVVHARRLIACHGCRDLPVVVGDRVVGVVSERDVQGRGPQPIGSSQAGRSGTAAGDQSPVSTVMSGPVVIARADEAVSTAAHRMLDHEIEALPVVDRGRFAGVLTLADCARALLAAQLDAGPEPAPHADDLRVGHPLEPA